MVSLSETRRVVVTMLDESGDAVGYMDAWVRLYEIGSDDWGDTRASLELSGVIFYEGAPPEVKAQLGARSIEMTPERFRRFMTEGE